MMSQPKIRDCKRYIVVRGGRRRCVGGQVARRWQAEGCDVLREASPTDQTMKRNTRRRRHHE